METITNVLRQTFVSAANQLEEDNIACRQVLQYVNRLLTKVSDTEATTENCKAFLNDLETAKCDIYRNFREGNIDYRDSKVLDGKVDELKESIEYYLENGEPLVKSLEDLKSLYETPATTADTRAEIAKSAERTGTEVPSWAK